jgi:hemerythrin-like metal-binding protein
MRVNTIHVEKIVFSDDLLVGIDIIDQQHKFLIALFNKVVDQLDVGFSDSNILAVAGHLFEYTKYHFSTEEQVMESLQYAKRHTHKKQHDAFVVKLKDLTRMVGRPDDNAVELVQFLVKWIQQHIFIGDKQIGVAATRGEKEEQKTIRSHQELNRYLEGGPTLDKETSIMREINVHKIWLRGKGSRRAELEFLDMSSMNLDNHDLSSAILTGVTLVRASLRGANLANATLVGADLEEADFTNANLSGADLRGANLHRTLLTAASLRGADLCSGNPTDSAPSDIESAPTVLTEAKLERAILCNAKLAGCDFSGADMAEADLAGADLSGSVMIGADLHGARLDGAILKGAVIDLSMLDAESARVIAAIGDIIEPVVSALTVEEFLTAVDNHEQWVDSGGGAGRRLDLDSARIPGVSMKNRRLSGCRMRKCVITGAEWPEADLSMSDLSYSNMTGINLEKGRLQGATLRRVNLSGANLASARLDALPLASGNRVWPTNLEGAMLVNANLSGASCGGVIMRKADLTGCRMEGISVRNADFTGARR